MSKKTEHHAQLDAFGAAYNYDVGYLKGMLDASEPAFNAFAGVQGMSSFRHALPRDAHFVARISTMLAEDCGPCTQLNLQMAIEAGVARTTLQTLLESPTALTAPLHDVYQHARSVSHNEAHDPARHDRLRAAYGEEGLTELAVVIAGARMYPTLKRALGSAQSCQRLSLDSP